MKRIEEKGKDKEARSRLGDRGCKAVQELEIPQGPPTKETLNMYKRAAVKSNDLPTQLSFALFLLQHDEYREEGIELLRRLSDKGFSQAQYYLGDFLFADGSHPREAFTYFALAAKQSHPEAAYRVSLCLEHGWGVKKDLQKAVPYLRKAASHGQPGAMLRLGQLCLNSKLIMPDAKKEGLNWYKRAAEAATVEYPAGPYELARLHENGTYADALFSDTQTIVELIACSADLGHAEASFRLGQCYEKGELDCPQNAPLAIHYLSIAAEAGHTSAMLNLCAWYLVGCPPILPAAPDQAFSWAKQAADLGFPKAEYTLGYFFEAGIGVRKDPLEANVWYVRAAEHGEERARQRVKGNVIDETKKMEKECIIM